MIGRILRRLAYARFLVQPGFWRWIVVSADYLVHDHIQPWTQLRRAPKAFIHPSVSFRHPQNVEIAEHTRIQNGCVLWASPKSKIRIGRYTGLGPGTMIFSSNHELTRGTPYYRQPWIEKDVTIGSDVWVGARCLIVAGVTIADGAVIAAGSVVTRDIPPNTIAAGVPAKVLKER